FVVQDSSNSVCRDDARDANVAEVGIDAHAGEHGAERVHRVALLFVAWCDVGARLDWLAAIVRYQRAAAFDVIRLAARRSDALAQADCRGMNGRSRARR